MRGPSGMRGWLTHRCQSGIWASACPLPVWNAGAMDGAGPYGTTGCAAGRQRGWRPLAAGRGGCPLTGLQLLPGAVFPSGLEEWKRPTPQALSLTPLNDKASSTLWTCVWGQLPDDAQEQRADVACHAGATSGSQEEEAPTLHPSTTLARSPTGVAPCTHIGAEPVAQQQRRGVDLGGVGHLECLAWLIWVVRLMSPWLVLLFLLLFVVGRAPYRRCSEWWNGCGCGGDEVGSVAEG